MPVEESGPAPAGRAAEQSICSKRARSCCTTAQLRALELMMHKPWRAGGGHRREERWAPLIGVGTGRKKSKSKSDVIILYFCTLIVKLNSGGTPSEFCRPEGW